MLLSTVVVQVILAILLFFAINWVGKHSVSIGYVEITIFSQHEDNPAFNFLIRVLSPQVYLIVVSSIFYGLKLDQLVINIYLVSIYYVIFRFLAGLVMGRLLLLNWPKQLLYWVAIISISYLLYENLIKNKKSILPDFSSVSNELWIIIMVFFYQLVNKLDFSTPNAAKRKGNYIHKKYLTLKKKYGGLIGPLTENKALEVLTYAILIYEDFNRPLIVRWIEYLVFFVTGRSHTLGIMQIRTNHYIGDRQSVDLGVRKITMKYTQLKNSELWRGFENEDQVARELVRDFNGGDSYWYEVWNLTEIIKEKFYKGDTDKLLTVIKEIGVTDIVRD
ncbi:hypothetical protein ACXZ1K_15845 [Pedobacter sp. PWIIR3]